MSKVFSPYHQSRDSLLVHVSRVIYSPMENKQDASVWTPSRSASLPSDSAIFLLPRGPEATEQRCKYKSGKCTNARATKRNGQLHTLCTFHRIRQNKHQRKSDRKHRMNQVERNAKLQDMGMGGRLKLRRQSAPSPNASVHSDMSQSSRSMFQDPNSLGQYSPPTHYFQEYQLPDSHRVDLVNRQSMELSPNLGPSVMTPRLPPISTLTARVPTKLPDNSDSGSEQASGMRLPPTRFFQSDWTSSQAGKMA